LQSFARLQRKQIRFILQRTLTVKDGQMTFHVSLASKKIVNLYVGMAADAEAHEGDWLQPTPGTATPSAPSPAPAAAAHAIVFSHFFITAPSYPDPATGN